jgi:flagellar assembly protein FliH
MTSTSSRILRDAEQAVVIPISWRATAEASPPRARISASEARDVAAAQPAFERDANAQQEQARIEQEAFNRGFAEGQAAGRKQTEAELQSVLEQMGRSLNSLAGLRSRIREDAEADLLKLAISIARRVLHRELTLDPESMEGLIRVALDKLQSRELCRVRVHPDQEQAIRKSLERFSNSQKVELITDASLQCGDVLFETVHGNLDASIESQLSEIERGLADRLRRLPQSR